MKVLFVVVAIWATANVIVPCNAGGHHDDSWWWRAMDGTPILMDRLTNRKKSVDHHSVVHSKWGNESEDVSAHGRFLAFGDYVDPTFSCPATITCPDICVASTDDCPADAVCPETFEVRRVPPDNFWVHHPILHLFLDCYIHLINAREAVP